VLTEIYSSHSLEVPGCPGILAIISV